MITVQTLMKLFAVADRPADVQILATARIEIYARKKIVGQLEYMVKDMLKRYSDRLERLEQELKDEYKEVKVIEVPAIVELAPKKKETK